MVVMTKGSGPNPEGWEQTKKTRCPDECLDTKKKSLMIGRSLVCVGQRTSNPIPSLAPALLFLPQVFWELKEYRFTSVAELVVQCGVGVGGGREGNSRTS